MRDIRLTTASSPVTTQEKMKWKARPYRSHLGVVGYLMLGSRPDVSYAYGQLSRYNDSYGQEHWDVLLRLVAYLKKTRETHYLALSKFGGVSFVAYCDSDWNGTHDSRSTTGWIVFFGGCPVSWVSRLQKCTSRSTGEAEFIALSSLAQEAVYLQMFAESLHIPNSAFEMFSNDKSHLAGSPSHHPDQVRTAVQIWTDSQVALAQAKKPDFWVVDKLRHIRKDYFFFKSYVRKAMLQLLPCSGTDNPSDIMTKGFGAPGKTAANQKAQYFTRHALFCLGHR